MSQPAASELAPEELLRELAEAVRLSSVCIASTARHAHPALEQVARELGIATTQRPSGEEDLVCMLAGRTPKSTLEDLHGALAAWSSEPFVLLIPLEGAPGAALDAARSLLAPPSRWLIRAGYQPGQPVMLATEELALRVPALPGEWEAAPVSASDLDSEPAALAAVWRAAQSDSAAIAAVAERIEADARRLEEARLAHERLSEEVIRLRAAERRELERVRLRLLEERTWVAEQAKRVAQSSSWRIGHGLVRTARRITLRRDRGTNLPARIAERMEEGDDF